MGIIYGGSVAGKDEEDGTDSNDNSITEDFDCLTPQHINRNSNHNVVGASDTADVQPLGTTTGPNGHLNGVLLLGNS